MQWNLLFAVVCITVAANATNDQTSSDEGPAFPSSDEVEKEWTAFKIKYDKTYENEAEESLRKKIFVDNLNEIVSHNHLFSKGLTSFELGINPFSDMETDEFLDRGTGYIPDAPSEEPVANKIFVPSIGYPLPDEIDWRSKGYVTKVKQQGGCGSCWAFGAIDSLEGQHFHKTGNLVELSVQQLVDCAKDNGCGGGKPRLAFYYMMSYGGGIATEESYPYEARNTTCRYNSSTVGAYCTGFAELLQTDLALKEAVAEVGPITVGIHVNGSTFKQYKDGVYNCPEYSGTLRHIMLVVGYGQTESGEEYWIVKNSWGEYWGKEGYIWISRNRDNQCGIANSTRYPLV